MVTLSSQFGKPYFPGNNPKGHSQGKLFADPKPTDEHRYQRGYTPERMQEVRGARMNIEAGPEGSGPMTGPAGVRHVQEVIARSKTPIQEINVPKTSWGTDMDPDDSYDLRINTGSKGAGGRASSAAGWYSGGGHYERGEIHIAGGAVGNYGGVEGAGQTLLHELGHYKSAKVEHNDSANYRTPVQRGKEEAFADDNEKERWRPDPRDVRKGTSKPPRGAYENEGAFQGLGGKKAHVPYVKARQTLNPEEKETILKHGFRPMDRTAQRREAAQHDAAVHINNTQFFHRDYAEEGRTGKPAWQVNPAHLPAMTHAEARVAGHEPLIHF